jgi:hypothetical protein
MFDVGRGDFDPPKRKDQSSFTQNVVDATQSWFNNANLIQVMSYLVRASVK